MTSNNLDKLGPYLPGSKIGVLLQHGLAGTPTEMMTIGRCLNKYGFSVLCPQLAGHCSTEADLVATNWRDWAESTAYAFEQLSSQMDAVFVGGLSMGAVLSLYLSERYPGKVKGMALYSTTLKYDGWSIPKLRFLLPLVLRLPYIGNRYKFEESFPYGIMNEKLRQRIVAQMHSGDSSAAGLASTPGTSVRELWRMVDAVKKDLAKVDAPALIVHARNDDIASLKNAMYVKNNLRSRAELLLLDNSYHMVTVDQERKKVCDATADFFLRQLSPAQRQELADKASKRLPQQAHDQVEGEPAPILESALPQPAAL